MTALVLDSSIKHGSSSNTAVFRASRPQQPIRNSEGTARFHLAAFLLGLGARLEVQVIGFLPLTEIAILLLAPFMLGQITSRPIRRASGWLIPLLVLWLLSLTFTDLYRGTQWSLAARGIARIIVFLLAIPMSMVFMRHDTYRKLVWLYVGLTISVILSGYTLKSGARVGRELAQGAAAELTWETHWVGAALSLLLLLCLLIYKRSHLLAYALCFAGGALNITYGSRSAGAMVVMGPFLAMGINLVRRRALVGRLRFATLVTVGLLGLLGALGTLKGYSWAAKSRLLGDRAYNKYVLQAQGKYGLVIGGRSDVLTALVAVRESPLIGYGSWPLDTKEFYLKACELAEEPADTRYYEKGYPVIRSHSHVMQAWVESGVLGTLFWLYALAILGWSLLVPLNDERRLRLWACVAAVALIWNISFSPISARAETALVLSTLLLQADVWPSLSNRRRRDVMAWHGSPVTSQSHLPSPA